MLEIIGTVAGLLLVGKIAANWKKVERASKRTAMSYKKIVRSVDVSDKEAALKKHEELTRSLRILEAEHVDLF